MIFWKSLGSVLVITAGGTVGLLGAWSIKRRVEQLKQLRIAMNFLEKEISYMQTPLSQALQRTAQFTPEPVKRLFQESSQALQDRQGKTVAEAWAQGVKILRRASDLRSPDLELIATVASQLGMSGAAEQKKFFQLIGEELRILEDQARLEAESGHKLWTYGGFILAATVVLLLI